MKRRWIKDLKENDIIDDLFLVADFSIKTSKNGKEYADCTFIDRTGKLSGKLWEAVDYSAKDFEAGVVCKVSGKIDSWNGKLQLKADWITPEPLYEMADFEAATKYNIKDMMDVITSTVHGFKDESVRAVALSILGTKDWYPRFCTSPAATGMHHAFKAGLLEHTTQMLQTADKMFELPFYEEALNKDLCMFGIMFHDFGKIFEYNQGAGNKINADGRLVPHIPMLTAIIYSSCERLGVPERIRNHLMHVILAHHGQRVFGSPVTPSSPEAAFVHYVDNLHGTVFGMVQAVEASKDEVVRCGYGPEAQQVLKERFSDSLNKLEASNGESSGISEPEAIVGGF